MNQEQPIQLSFLNKQQLKEIFNIIDKLRDIADKKVDIAAALREGDFSGKCHFLADAIKDNRNPTPIRSVFQIAVERLKADCCLIEYPYLDMEYWNSYAQVYSRSFKNYSRKCHRIHFFHGSDGKADNDYEGLKSELENGCTEKAMDKLGLKYLGFVVLRPTPSYNVGRVCLGYQEQVSNMEKMRCKGSAWHKANLLGAQLEVKAVPFIQQDVVTGMCATASCWTAAQILADRFELYKFPYSEISRRAHAESSGECGHIPLGRGMRFDEIVRALTHTGARVMTVLPKKPGKDLADAESGFFLRHALYSYVESHLPVILLLDEREEGQLHAVCAVGHGQEKIEKYRSVPKPIGSKKVFKDERHHFVSDTVSLYYVHNDSYGPYDRIRFLDDATREAINKEVENENKKKSKEVEKKKKWICPVYLHNSDRDERNVIADVLGLIVPVPPYVMNRANDVMAQPVNTMLKFGLKKARGDVLKKKWLWRLLLVKGSEFKRTLADRKYPDVVKGKYATLHLPKYVWLYEFTLFDENETSAVLGVNDSRKIHGEVLLDTSTPGNDINVIAYRIGGMMLVMERDGKRRAVGEPKLAMNSPRDCFVHKA